MQSTCSSINSYAIKFFQCLCLRNVVLLILFCYNKLMFVQNLHVGAFVQSGNYVHSRPYHGFPITLVSGRFINPETRWGSDFFVNNQLKNAGIRPKRLPSKSYVVACATNINPYSSLVKAYVSTKIGHSLSAHSGPSRKPNIASMGKRKNDDIQFEYFSSTWPPKRSQGDARILIEVAYQCVKKKYVW